MKKNILIFANSTSSDKGMSGGAQMLNQIFKRIRDRFGVMYCYTNSNCQDDMEKEVRDVKYILSYNYLDRFNIFLGFVLKTLKAFSCLKLHHVDIIYSSSDFFPDVIPSYVYKLFHRKAMWYQCIFHIYPSWKERPGNKVRNFVAQYMQKFSLLLTRRADSIININPQVREILINKGFEKNKIVVNTPGIDFIYLDSIKPSDAKYDASFLARLSYSKGIFDLVSIWENVCKEIKTAKLAIIGGGNTKVVEKLKDEIKSRGLDSNIDLLGFLSNDETFPIIKASKVFLFPSHEEGFGIVIAEAVACGVPVVAWNLPVYLELFEDHIVKITENDVTKFSEEVINLLKKTYHTEKAVSLAKDFVKKYDWGEIAQKHAEILSC